MFADPRTLISRNALDRELEQAVRFLHDNGTMLHYEDPLLSDLYFVDPQWLCDMLAHIVTVREINPLVRDGQFVNLSISCAPSPLCVARTDLQTQYIMFLFTFLTLFECMLRCDAYF